MLLATWRCIFHCKMSSKVPEGSKKQLVWNIHCLVGLSLQPVVENLTVVVYGGTVKKLVARANLQRPLDNQTLPVEKMLEYCKSNIKGINLINITNVHIAPACRAMLSIRFKSGKTIPGAMSFHHFRHFLKGMLPTRRWVMMKLLLEHSNFSTLCWQIKFAILKSWSDSLPVWFVLVGWRLTTNRRTFC